MKHLVVCCAILIILLGGVAAGQQLNTGTSSGSSDSGAGSADTKSGSNASTNPSFHDVWTFGLKFGFFKVGERQMYYEVQGSGKETLIVIPGSPGTPHDYFHPLLASLSRFARVIYFDRRADGLPQGRPARVMTMDSMMEDIESLRAALGLNRVNLLAHGFGGVIALNYAVKYPANIKSMVLLGVASSVEGSAAIESRLMGQLSSEDSAKYHAMTPATVEGPSQSGLDLNQSRLLLPYCFFRPPAPFLVNDNAYTLYFEGMARDYLLYREHGDADLTPLLKGIAAPVLVLSGRHDEVTPPALSEKMAQAFPRSRFVILEHSGHFPQAEESALFTEWVRRFLFDTSDGRDDNYRISRPASADSVINSMPRVVGQQ